MLPIETVETLGRPIFEISITTMILKYPYWVNLLLQLRDRASLRLRAELVDCLGELLHLLELVHSLFRMRLFVVSWGGVKIQYRGIVIW